MKKITTAVIPIAGYGERMRPATLMCPKPFLPLGVKPAILQAINECSEAGMQRVLFITNKDLTRTQRDYIFSLCFKRSMFAYSIRQRDSGLEGAVSIARRYCVEPFVLLLPDELYHPTTLKALMETRLFDTETSVLTKKIKLQDQHKYGILNKGYIVEKPAKGTTDSTIAIGGRYILQPTIFKFLEADCSLTEAINSTAQVAYVHYKYIVNALDAYNYDIGSPEGYIKAFKAFTKGV